MGRALERPPKITPEGDDGYFEELTKAIFRAGFSWPVVRDRWGGFVKVGDAPLFQFDQGVVGADGVHGLN